MQIAKKRAIKNYFPEMSIDFFQTIDGLNMYFELSNWNSILVGIPLYIPYTSYNNFMNSFRNRIIFFNIHASYFE